MGENCSGLDLRHNIKQCQQPIMKAFNPCDEVAAVTLIRSLQSYLYCEASPVTRSVSFHCY